MCYIAAKVGYRNSDTFVASTTSASVLTNSQIRLTVFIDLYKLNSSGIVSFMPWRDVVDVLEHHSIGANGYRNTVRYSSAKYTSVSLR